MEFIKHFFGDFASDGSDIDAANGNSYKDYYSDDDDLFSPHDASNSEVFDNREESNTQTPTSKPFISPEINTENGPKSSNSGKCNKDHSNDKRDEIPKRTLINHNYIKK